MVSRAASRELGGRAKAPTELKVAVSSVRVAAPVPTGVAQLSLEATAVPAALKTVRTGSARTPGRLKGEAPRVGPMARMRTCLLAPGPITKPAVRTEAPVPVWARVEILERRGSWARAAGL